MTSAAHPRIHATHGPARSTPSYVKVPNMRRLQDAIPTSVVIALICVIGQGAARADLDVLFLGDNGHHRPRERFAQLEPVLKPRGIHVTYTENMDDLNLRNLREYDALILYANIDSIEPPRASALLDYVESGGGFVPLHCATYCFRNNQDVVALMGGQFLRHSTGTFRTEIAEPEHPVMQSFGGFESWDETYVHHLHNEQHRTVLAYRVDAEGREPWTWVRTHGAGRVFYTAWGHDQRTWGHPGFQNLVERGIRWAAGEDPAAAGPFLRDAPFPVPNMTARRTDVAPFAYRDVGAKIPNYPPSQRWGTQEEPLSQMQLPLPPAESIKHFVMPEGFHLELFVSEPELGGKPIYMAWDERGRLWVAETYDYPNELHPPGQGRDRIRICEDMDGDWKADKFTVFAENLSIPTTLTFHRGGVIVQDSTRTLYLRDVDGDDVADEQTVLFTGWNQRDTHGGVSNFQYGLDNWIWAMQGYNPSRPAPPGQGDDSDLRFAAGFWRFRPDGSRIEFIRSTNNNTWGLGISEEGIIFGSTANRNPSVYMPIPNRYYERVQGWTPSLMLGTIADTHLFRPITEKVRQVDQHGGYTAGAGHALYTARNYPQAYWNRVAFVNGPTGHLVGTFVIQSKGADFQSKYTFNLLASDDEWTAPIMAEVGPDGNVWVIDWYNFIVQHNPTPRGFETGPGNAYATDLRDKKHGRIYRLVHDAAAAARPFSLAGASPEQLVATLRDTNMFWRKHAQRLLVEQGNLAVVPELCELVRDPSVDEIGLNTAAIHALWTLHALGALDGAHDLAQKAVISALRHPSAGVRRNAVQVLPSEPNSVTAVLEANLLQDASPQVHLATLLALSDLPAPLGETAHAVGRALADAAHRQEAEGDAWLGDAMVAAAASHADTFLQAIAASSALSEDLAERVKIVAEHYARKRSVDTVESLIAALLEADPAVAQTVISGLAEGWPGDAQPQLDPGFEQALEQLFHRLDTRGRGQLLRLSNNWGSGKLARYSDEIARNFLETLDDEEAAESARVQAAAEFVQFRATSAAAVHAILDRITPQTTKSLGMSLMQTLRNSDVPELGEIVARRITSVTPAVRTEGIQLLLRRRDAMTALLDAIDAGEIQLAELSLDQRQNLTRHPDRDVRRRAERLLARGGALPSADRQKVIEDLIAVTKVKGDPRVGLTAFKKVCAKCHRHSGEGTDIGPDLTGMAVHPKEELLVHILDPNRSVESNFRIYSVVTLDGRVINGMLASESLMALEFFDAEGKKTTILREEIDEFVGSQNSLMPEGVEKELTRQELTDLLEFLTQRGSFQPLDLRSVATVCSDAGMFNGGDGRYELDDWNTRTVSGVPFELINPQDDTKNFVLLHGPLGAVSRTMPRSVSVEVGYPARAIHLLSGVSGWGFPYSRRETVSLIVRFYYDDGTTEDHALINGRHFADYIRHIDVPESEHAFNAGQHQMRYLALYPSQPHSIERLDFVKGDDRTAPLVMAVTIETP